ncbi:DsbA family protein [Hymenobacter sp. RP-2-7]|uniref:DsbA family protein n=1 Tax=Hymenobacter polaris TaxID=2682546 RepID=A0A7Y0FMB0_9BACT|nr:DsbA family protein [Hymenobacter polaris]NML65311.1 DsbA family protein [Hymenobacter polaris]
MSHLQPEIGAGDHRQGPADAPLQLVEYGDYQCSYCGEAYPAIKAAQQALGDKLAFVFRNFPLPDVHPQAQGAALAAEAAAQQGKFWEMHNALYEHQNQLDDQHLEGFAQRLGLDVERFKRDMQSQAAADKVEADFESGIRSGVNGTPSFFVNGQKFDGNWQGQGLLEFLQQQ